MDCSLPGSSIHGIFQARTLEFPTPGTFLTPRIEPTSLLSRALAGRLFTTAPSGKPGRLHNLHKAIWLKVGRVNNPNSWLCWCPGQAAPNVPQWHICYSKLELPKREPMHRIYSAHSFCLHKSRKWISHVKFALPASGGMTPLSPEIGNWGQEAYTQRNLVTSLTYYPKSKMFRFFTNWAPQT